MVVVALGRLLRGTREFQGVYAVHHDLIAFLDTTSQCDPPSVIRAEVRDYAEHSIGVVWIAAVEHVLQPVLDYRLIRNRPLFLRFPAEGDFQESGHARFRPRREVVGLHIQGYRACLCMCREPYTNRAPHRVL